MQVTCCASQAIFDLLPSNGMLPMQRWEIESGELFLFSWEWSISKFYNLWLNRHLFSVLIVGICVSNYKLGLILVIMIVRGYLCLNLKPRISLYSWFSLSSRIREKEASLCHIEHAVKFPRRNHQVTSWERCLPSLCIRRLESLTLINQKRTILMEYQDNVALFWSCRCYSDVNPFENNGKHGIFFLK